MWRALLSELTARGWRAFAFGPEFWLGFPALLTFLLALGVMGGRDE